ncbi:hypothetical protein G4X40_05460 [Rhodococcus sp. D2-41]|uniref:Uncharacterized protein n=1 Tax=Speluncibacter jeojiensis TaxID=2710754 RepID=A0A9X4RFK9_9ACTN|nr:hypothetical protein [Rhodococcus sp. D2-41]MDG3009589.1 hypothetical protein [Rhodococcus sp. D2-41]MDG3016793.1 hypothetical protein [Corynebacteriales bacterium D3-21]
MSTETGPERFQVLTVVELLLEAVRDGDRWSIARRATGPLLRQLLSAESEPAYARLRDATLRGLAANPVAAVDGDHAVVMGAVTGSDHGPIPLVAILIRADGDSWLVAELDTSAAVDPGRLMAAALGRARDREDPTSTDARIIADASPLDPRAAAIDWDDPTEVIRTTADGPITVADALADLPKFGRSCWTWLADDGVMFLGLYLRARHPELVREPDRPTP